MPPRQMPLESQVRLGGVQQPPEGIGLLGTPRQPGDQLHRQFRWSLPGARGVGEGAIVHSALPGRLLFNLRRLKLKKKKVKGLNYDIDVDDTGTIIHRGMTMWGGSIEFTWYPTTTPGCTSTMINTIERTTTWETFDASGNPSVANDAKDRDPLNPLFNIGFGVDGAKGPMDPTSSLVTTGKTKFGMEWVKKHDDPAMTKGAFLAAAQQGASADRNAKQVKVTVTWVVTAWFVEVCNGVYSTSGFHQVTVTATMVFNIAGGQAQPDESGQAFVTIDDTDSGPGTAEQKAKLNGATAGYGVRVR